MRNRAGADERYVRYGGMRGQMIRGRGPADERLDKVGRVAADTEGGPGDGRKVGEGPGCLFRGFKNTCRTSEEG